MDEPTSFIPDLNKSEAENASDFAAHKAKSAKMADEVSREVHQQEMLGQTKEVMVEALREVFGDGDKGSSGEMNILVRRIPFICNDIAQIHKDNKATTQSIEKINGNITWGVRIVIGAVILGLLKLIFLPGV